MNLPFNRWFVRVMFSPWSSVVLAGVVALALLTFGLSTDDWSFWILMVALVGPWILWDVVAQVIYAHRGKSYSEVRRRVRDLTLDELQRQKRGGRDAG